MERLPYAVVAARGDSNEDTGVPAPGNPAGRRPRSTSPQTPPANHWQLMLGPTQRLPQSPRSRALPNLVRRAGAWTCPGGLADGTLYPCCTSTVMDKLWQAAFNFCGVPMFAFFLTWKQTRDCGRQVQRIRVAGARDFFFTTVIVVATWMRAAKTKAA